MVNSHKDSATKTNFIIYFVSRLISDLGSSIFSFALSLYVLDVTVDQLLYLQLLWDFHIYLKLL